MRQFCKGEGAFEHFWHPGGPDDEMVVNDIYSRLPVIIRQDTDVSERVLELKNFTSTEMVNGRMLTDRA